MSDPAHALIKQLYQDAGVADWGAIAAVMADDFIIHEPPTLPYGGEWRGRDALERLFMTVLGYWDDPLIEQDSLSSDGTTVVAMVRLTITSRRTGERVTHRIAEVSRVEGGKVVEMRIYYYDSARFVAELTPG